MSKTFVLVHGAWHGGWCWAEVASILSARGHRVSTPTQTGLGERRHLISDTITLQTFIDDVVNHILAEDLHDVVLVGHSFGGNAVSGAAEAVPERLRALVYLDCTLLFAGERLADKLPGGEVAARIRRAEGETAGVAVPPPPASAFGILDPALEARVQARLTPHPVSTLFSPLPIRGLPGNGLPARYVLCTAPAYHDPARVAGWMQRTGWPVVELPTGHDAMLTAPDALADVLDAD